MHHTLTALVKLGWAFVPGLLFLTLMVLPELLWQNRNRPGCLRDCALWFCVAVLLLICLVVMPYLLLNLVEAR